MQILDRQILKIEGRNQANDLAFEIATLWYQKLKAGPFLMTLPKLRPLKVPLFKEKMHTHPRSD